MVEEITFITQGGIKIIADHYTATSIKGVILVHMMPATKESWRPLAAKLHTAGFQVLAIDLRGHGKSDGGPNGYRAFSDAEHQASIHDVDAAAGYLKNKGVSELYLGGASIGANLVLQYMAQHPDIKGAVFLSTGLDYHGVKTEIYAQRLKQDRSVYFIAASDDMRSSGSSAADMAQRLYDLSPAKKEIKIFSGSDHGTDILDTHPGLNEQLIMWLSKL